MAYYDFDSTGGAYDPFTILNKAQMSSSNWWNNTLDNARKNYNNEQQAFKDSFQRDRAYKLHDSDVASDLAQNTYNALNYQDKTDMLNNSRSDDNMQARYDEQNFKLQKPAYDLYQSDTIVNAPTRSQGIRDAFDNMPERFKNTPGMQGYGGGLVQQQNIRDQLDAIASGDERSIGDGFSKLGLGEVRRDPLSGGYVIRTANGESAPMSREQLVNYARGRTGLTDKEYNTPYTVQGSKLADEYRKNEYLNNRSSDKSDQHALDSVRKMLADKDVLANADATAYYKAEEQRLTRKIYGNQTPSSNSQINWNQRIIGGGSK